MTGGAKAGLAIGILLAFGLLLALIFFCYRRRRKQVDLNNDNADDEKLGYMDGLKRAQSVASTRTTATAPRLSLRPLTQFMPNLASRGESTAAPAAATGAVGGPGVARDVNNNPENPFGNHAEVPPPKALGVSEKAIALPLQANAPEAENPFGKNAEVVSQTNRGSIPSADLPAPLRIRTPTPEVGAIAGGALAAGAAGGIAAAKMAERHNAPKPLNLSPNRSVSPAAPSPAASEFSQTSAPAGALNGPPPSNVYRIQLDFKPSMDDELSLRAGQLVRLLHEYDDGWVSSN